MRRWLRQWSLHSCALSPDCRREMTGPMGPPPWRVHINTPWWHFAFALRPGDRFSRWNKNEWTMWVKKP